MKCYIITPEADESISILDDSLCIDWKMVPTEYTNLSEKKRCKALMQKDFYSRSVSIQIAASNTLFFFVNTY